MPRKKNAVAVSAASENLYEKAEDLPEGRKKIYDSILEDFDKQVAARIEQINSACEAIESQIKSQFKVALLKIPRNVRQMKAEDFYEKNDEAFDLTVECAKVAVSVSNDICKEVKETTSVSKKQPRRTTKKKSSILAQGPRMSSVRRSTRKRNVPSWLSETPLASSTLTGAALGGFSTIKSTRAKGRVLQTPMITPKFDLATPLNRTVTRVQKADEKFLVSMNGSPVYVGGKGKSAKNENLIPLPLGNGKTLMVPADNPEVQPLVQNLIKSCMTLMGQK